MAVVAYVHLQKTRLNLKAGTMDFKVTIGIDKAGREAEVSTSKDSTKVVQLFFRYL